MTRVYLALGSNLGDRLAYLQQACDQVGCWPKTTVVKLSQIYETDPVGGPEGQPAFLNMVAAVQTALEPEMFLKLAQDLETHTGRLAEDKRVKDGPRTLDLDVLIWGDQIIDQPGLHVPHPRMAQRWFVLKPLADLAPDLIWPGQTRSVAELLNELDDGGWIFRND